MWYNDVFEFLMCVGVFVYFLFLNVEFRYVGFGGRWMGVGILCLYL